MNATYLFELTKATNIPPSSEHFWTTLFVVFLSYLSSIKQATTIRAWECRFGDSRPWYKRSQQADLNFEKVAFDDFAIEPKGVTDVWSNLIGRIDPKIGGIDPDIILKFKAVPPSWALIENKVTTSAALNSNQLTAYPELVELLNKNSIECRLFLLQSVGCGDKLYEQAGQLQNRLGTQFGILFWEDIFREMVRTKFKIGHLDFGSWMEFTTALDSECEA